jgi:transketolase
VKRQVLEVQKTNADVIDVGNRIKGTRVREIIIEQSKRAGVGHIGSALSVADIMACLYGGLIKATNPSDPDRDRFILSKGHAALALYAVLHLRGWLSEKTLNSFCADGSSLGVHPELVCPGVDFATGSLGQGLSFGCGAALAARLQKSSRKVFVLISDAECNEGSVWEAIMFAAHHHLSNLVVIVDLNGQQAFGYTRDVLDTSPLAERWRAFNWDVHSVDGHNTEEISSTVEQLNFSSGQPHVLIANTTFGKGVSFMESQIKWHYSPLSDDEYEQARKELRQDLNKDLRKDVRQDLDKDLRKGIENDLKKELKDHA